MKLTFITNACCIYESQGFRLMSDPWLVPGAFGTWVQDPPLKTKPEDVKDVDALYISHIHPDHLCEQTLSVFRRDIPIITLKDRLSLAEKKLTALGFTNLICLEDKETGILKSVSSPVHMEVTIFGPFTKHPFHADACEIGNVVDSALLIRDGRSSVLNTNDNTPSYEAAEWLAREYGPFTIAQLNWNNAGPYPACFSNLSDDEKRAEAKRCLDRNLYHMAAVARRLKPKATMPFAGAYKLGYGKEHLNEFLGTCPAEEAVVYMIKKGLPAFCMTEGESIVAE